MSRFLLHGRNYRYRVLEPQDIFFLEADGDETLLRLRGRQRLHDVRSLGEVLRKLRKHGFREIHRGIAVNLDRVQVIRRRDAKRGWEIRLAPPVNRVLPVSPGRIEAILKALDL